MVGPKLAKGQKLDWLSVIGQVLVIWWQLLQRFGFLDWFLQLDLQIVSWLPGLVSADNGLVSRAGCCRLWVLLLYKYMVWPLSVCIFSFS